MDWFLIAAIVYAVVALVFFILIRIEAVRQESEFSYLQPLVALFWPIWAVWYGWVVVGDWFEKRKRK